MAKYPNCRKRQIGGHTYWIARLVFPPNPNTGARLRPPKEFSAKTAAGAHAAREKAREEFRQNPTADHSTVLADFIEAEFIPFEEARYRNGELSWGRYQERRSRLRRFFLDHTAATRISRCDLGSLTPEMFERFFDDLLRAGVGANLRNRVRQDLMLALRKAKRRLQFPVSEFFLDIPVAGEKRKRKLLFTADDIIDRIQDESLPVESRAIVAFEFIINCRPNEMWPLLWSDIDWRADQVSINKALQRDESGFTVKDCTKTGRDGDRTLPLGSLLSALLRQVESVRLGSGVSSEYVFCRSDGTRHDKDSFSNRWEQIRGELHLPKGPTFYSLKTTGNTYALANGIPSAVQAKKMGHTTTRMADNDYRTIMDAEIVKAVEIYGKRPKPTV